MARRRRGTEPFAAVLAALPEPAAAPTARARPGELAGAVLWDRSGREFRVAVAAIPGSRAQQLAGLGAQIAWDTCGCGGYCGRDWVEGEDLARFLSGPAPRVLSKDRSWSGVAEWRAGDGAPLVLLSGSVRFGAADDT